MDAGLSRGTGRREPTGPVHDVRLARELLQPGQGNVALEEQLWPKLDLVVDINFRMDSTAMYSDIVLPAASHYEKYDLSETDMHTYVHPFTPAVEPLGEAKTDWEIFRLLAEKIQERAQERGVEPIEDRKFDRTIDLTTIYDDYVRDWETGEEEGSSKTKPRRSSSSNTPRRPTPR